MPKSIILPEPPDDKSSASITRFLFEYELKRAVKEMGREIKDLPYLTPFSRDRIARILWGNEKHGIKKASYKPEELAYFSRFMDWGRNDPSLNRFFNHVFVATGKPKTEYEVELETKVDVLINYMKSMLPRMTYEEGVKMKEFLDSLETKQPVHDYPKIDFAMEAVKS